MAEKTLLAKIGPYQRLYRDDRTGIAWVADGSTGLGHSAHPNIDASGSVSGMKARGYWTKRARTVRSHGYIYNIDSCVLTDKYDELAAAFCRCGGNHGGIAPQELPDFTLTEDGRLVLAAGAESAATASDPAGTPIRTRVVYRRFPSLGDERVNMVAILVDLPAGPGLVTTYQTNGQHGAGDYRAIIDQTTPHVPPTASNRELRAVLALHQELEGLGYVLTTIRHWDGISAAA